MHYQADTSISIGENLSNSAFISRNMYENQPIGLDIYFFKEVNVSFTLLLDPANSPYFQK